MKCTVNDVPFGKEFSFPKCCTCTFRKGDRIETSYGCFYISVSQPRCGGHIADRARLANPVYTIDANASVDYEDPLADALEAKFQ